MSKRTELLDFALAFSNYCDDMYISDASDHWNEDQLDDFLQMKKTFWEIHEDRMKRLVQ